ncbi:MBL fold metallo-hydrolase [Undibacterium pigrum]|uniref:Metallo-beta-lactamase superfamily protein n=1 Tax=Undibacterium pigrum TaxID=401470 RepID=A0A318J264_9BURK|nr:MBL fold metallo-hydrolase [Undibacterium pigrum]PXX42625.1 metallo-beta-lactamase superfamily protein [Undibacterium pigrum]
MFTSQVLPPGLPLSAILASICILLASGSTQAQTMPPNFAVTLDMQGTRLASHQAATPQNAVQEIKLKQQLILQKDGHFRSVSESVWPGNIKFHFLSSGNRDGVATVDLLQWRQGVEIEREDATKSRNAYADYLFLSPALLLEHASNRQPIKLPGKLSGQENEELEQWSFNDAAGRPASMIMERSSSTVLSAKSANFTYEYADYRAAENFKQAQKIIIKNGDKLVVQWTINTQVADHIDAHTFDLPAGYIEQQDKGTLRATMIAPGTYRVDGSESGYHSSFSVGTHSVAIYDAPVSIAEGSKIRALIEQTAPGRKLAYIVLSHTHKDHIAGTPAYMQEGIQILTGKDGRLAVQRQLGEDVASKVSEVSAPRELDLGGRSIRIYPMASSHASDMLVAYDEGYQIIFQGDLYYLPEIGPVPPVFDVGMELDSLIRQHQLQVQQLVGVHGRSGTWQEFKQALELRMAARPAMGKT